MPSVLSSTVPAVQVKHSLLFKSKTACCSLLFSTAPSLFSTQCLLLLFLHSAFSSFFSTAPSPSSSPRCLLVLLLYGVFSFSFSTVPQWAVSGQVRRYCRAKAPVRCRSGTAVVASMIPHSTKAPERCRGAGHDTAVERRRGASAEASDRVT